VVVPRKLGAPGNPELAIGAVAPGVRVLDQRMMGILGVTEDYLEREVEAQEREIERRTTMYREGREPPALAGATVIVVDDGVATGSTAMAALAWVRAAGAARVVFAAPVGPRAALAELGAYADDVIILETPASFRAVGEWFAVFDQVTDQQVLADLRGAA
jgi:putative phosphoribosyl transferase